MAFSLCPPAASCCVRRRWDRGRRRPRGTAGSISPAIWWTLPTGGDTRADVEELPDSGSTMVRTTCAGRPGRSGRRRARRHDLLDLFCHLAVYAEIVGAIKEIVVHASRIGHGRVDAVRHPVRVLGHWFLGILSWHGTPRRARGHRHRPAARSPASRPVEGREFCEGGWCDGRSGVTSNGNRSGERTAPCSRSVAAGRPHDVTVG